MILLALVATLFAVASCVLLVDRAARALGVRWTATLLWLGLAEVEQAAPPPRIVWANGESSAQRLRLV